MASDTGFKFYQYDPSFAAAVAFISFFGIAALWHLWLIIELGEQGLTPASNQVTYLLLLTSFLLVSLNYYYTEYKNDYPFHSIIFFIS